MGARSHSKNHVGRNAADNNDVAIFGECWIVDQFYHERLRAEDDLSRHLRSGALKPINNVVEGFENLPMAVVGLYTTARSGKLQVRFDPA
jgi:NADPH-dependent curcumin reductase CurA